MRVSPDDLEWWLDFYPRLEWTFAKTYAETAPHHYVYRGRTIGWEEGERVISLIRTFGVPQKYWSTVNIYLVADGQKWWFDWRHPILEECRVINMAPADQFFGTQDAPKTKSPYYGIYDAICMEYDEVAGDRWDEEIGTLVLDALPRLNPKVLDVGCGTGKLLDMGLTTWDRFVGVDPSQGMLNSLLRKYPPPRMPRDIRPARIEDVYDEFVDGEFDLVAGLYGSPSYVEPEVMEQLPALSSGATLLMTYKPGYLPVWYRDFPMRPAHAEAVAETAALMGGRRYEMGNYDVTVI